MVRVARPEEYERVGELAARVFLDDGFLPADHMYLAMLRDAASRAAKAELLVAEDGAGQVVGSVTFATGGSPYSEAEPGEASFRMLVVDPAARGRGVGEALVRACIERATRAGARVLRLSTLPEMHAAHRLYERLGFTRTPERDWTPVGGVRLRTYALPLG
jgi:ribosomal protein S18 acetylase RimI-like enzyme